MSSVNHDQVNISSLLRLNMWKAEHSSDPDMTQSSALDQDEIPDDDAAKSESPLQKR